MKRVSQKIIKNNETQEKQKHKPINKFSGLESDNSDDETMVENKIVVDIVEKKPVAELKEPEKFDSTKNFNNTEGIEKSSSFSKFEGAWETASKKRNKKDFGKSDFVRKQNQENSDEENSNDKQLYVEQSDPIVDFGNEKYLHSRWTVWIHKSDCKEWKESHYTNVYQIDSIGSFWRFFNNFHLFDKQKNQFFIMRNKIKPIWEDNENRDGGICSIKFECPSKPGKIDIGVNAMIAVCLLVMNETFISTNEEINGISYSIKNRSVLIKLWYKDAKKNNVLINGERDNEVFKSKLPASLVPLKIYSVLKNNEKGFGRKTDLIDDVVSIKCKEIKPEWEVE